MSNKFLVWCDIETTGLDVERDEILEVGFTITDLELSVIREKSWLIWGSNESLAMASADPFVRQMHANNKLITECIVFGLEKAKVEEEIVNWLSPEEFSPEDTPICGSSIHFDRSFLAKKMPQVQSMFSYRNLDVSSYKEWVRHNNPSLEAEMKQALHPRKAHRASPDIRDTLEEFRYYLENTDRIQPR